MLRGNKHSTTTHIYSNFSGGINVSLPPEQIAENEMQDCLNMVYATNSLKLIGRGGLVNLEKFESKITAIHYDISVNKVFVFLDNKRCYLLTIGDIITDKKYIGDVTGRGKPKCQFFNGKLFIASGGLLQFYDYKETSTVTTITQSPICDMLFYRFGRLAVVKTGNDKLQYSAIGDAVSEKAWVENLNDESSAKWLEVGSYDNGDILDVVALSSDLMIFKNNGYVYQFTGDNSPNSWVVTNPITSSDMIYGFTQGYSACNIGAEVVYLSERGMRAISTSQDYGNIANQDIGSKFNSLLTNSLNNPMLFALNRRKTILIQPKANEGKFLCFNYGVNACTILEFGVGISFVCETKDEVLLGGIDGSLYKMSHKALTDDGKDIVYRVHCRDILSEDELIVKAVDTKLNSSNEGDVAFSTSNLVISKPNNKRHKTLCNHSTDRISPKLESNTPFCVEHLNIKYGGL